MKVAKKRVEVSVISDFHLATFACRATLILKYLKSIHPEILVLNGDIIDSWRFSINYFPKSHSKVLRYLLKMMENGVKIYYITGNHDDSMRKFSNVNIGGLSIINQLELNLNNQKTWILHGDIFDTVIYKLPILSRYAAALKGFIYLVDKLLHLFSDKTESTNSPILYKSMKSRIIKDQKILTKFESSIADAAIKKGADTVICGHTHFPVKKTIATANGTVNYINCGDWVENFTSAEYSEGVWYLSSFNEADIILDNTPDEELIPDNNIVIQSILEGISTS